MLENEHSGASFRYLPRAAVVAAAAEVDVVATVREALIQHAAGAAALPAEAYLGWETPQGFSARSIAMQGAIPAAAGVAYGLKVINASLGNVDHGLPRSQGLTFLFDPESARPVVMMEAAYISALRTAGVTIATALQTGAPHYRSLALIGCGSIAKAHVLLAERHLDQLQEVRLYDVVPERAREFAAAITERTAGRWRVLACQSARECVSGADLVVPVTTVTTGYIAYDWLRPGSLVAHVSLDDLLPEVVERADSVFVDDWDLVSDDHRRLFGRMYRQGTLAPPGGRPGPADGSSPRGVDATLGDVFSGAAPGRKKSEDILVSNPFGMAILDVAVAAAVHRVAVGKGYGTEVDV